MHPDTIGMWDAGVDYFRITHRRDGTSNEIANKYARAVETLGRRNEDAGTRGEPWQWRGYRGERVGSAAWGEHDAGLVLQVSGGSAREVLAMDLPYTNAPRIDLQVTFWLKEEETGVARDAASVAASYRPRRRGRRAKVRYIDGFGDGDTAYIGSRGKKSKFLRIYYKWKESEEDEQYRYAWRYEAELTDDHAGFALRTLRTLPQTRYTIFGLVAGYFAERGVELPDVAGVAAIPPDKLPVDIGSDERRIRWLRHQVAPTIEKLLSGGVRVQDVVAALGLTKEQILLAYLHHAK